MSAVTLDAALRSQGVIDSTVIPHGFSARYFELQAKRTAVAWYARIISSRLSGTDVFHSYLGKLLNQ